MSPICRQIKEGLLMKKIYFAAPLFNEMELKEMKSILIY